jgi:uncharacterized protein YsxB (DUF464 family)
VIKIKLTLDKVGCVRAVEACGHAGRGPSRGDVVCAAVSVLLRTFAEVLATTNGVTAAVEAPTRGSMAVKAAWQENRAAFVSGVSAFLVEGLDGVAAEYPNNCKIILEELNGT